MKAPMPLAGGQCFQNDAELVPTTRSFAALIQVLESSPHYIIRSMASYGQTHYQGSLPLRRDAAQNQVLQHTRPSPMPRLLQINAFLSP
jgi:hypothetical protein